MGKGRRKKLKSMGSVPKTKDSNTKEVMNLETTPKTEILKSSSSKGITKGDFQVLETEAGSKIREELRKEKDNYLTIFGIFASILTIVSVEANVFKNICDPKMMLGVSLYFIGSLLVFLLLLQLITKGWVSGGFTNRPFLLLIFLIFLIAIIFWQAGKFIKNAQSDYVCHWKEIENAGMEEINRLNKIKIEELESRVKILENRKQD